MSAKKRAVRVLDLVLVLLLLAAVIAGIAWAGRLRQRITSIQTSLAAVEGMLDSGPEAVQVIQDPGQVAALQGALARLDANLAAVHNQVRPLLPLAPHLGWLPGIGGDVVAAPHLLEMAQETSLAANALLDGLAPLAQELDGQGSSLDRLGPTLVSSLEQAGPQLAAAQAALANAAQARSEINPDELSPWTRALLDRFDPYLPQLADGVDALLLLPDMLGAGGPRTYLLLAQNNHELRATGGFISGVGRIELDGGEITGLHFQDSYTVDDLAQPHPPAPGPLRQHMGAGILLLRDANWWPDFDTSARAVAGLYLQDQGQEVDGVIAVDLTALRLLLQALGPIEVPGYDQAVSSGNLQAMIATYWQAPRLGAPGKEGTDWWLHRKDFAADLLSALMEQLVGQAPGKSTTDLAALGLAGGQALQERHITVYVNDEEGQLALSSLGWDGALRPYNGDYLMIVDSNVGFNKVNPNVEQWASYEVNLDESDGALAKLTLTYRHRVQRPAPACIHESRYGDSYADLMERCYWDHVRVYVPLGSEVLEVAGADGEPQVYEESGRTVIATSFLLETGQERRIDVHYRPNLPPRADGYELLVQKQPGTEAMPLRISVTPPAGAMPTGYAPPGWTWLDARAVWQGDLARDRTFALSWQ